jgi:hypothetical protein
MHFYKVFMYKQYLQKTMRRQYLMNKRSVLTENLFWVMIQISKGHAKNDVQGFCILDLVQPLVAYL